MKNNSIPEATELKHSCVDSSANLPTILTEKEVADLLRCSPRHVRNLVNRRIIPVVKLGRSRRFRRDSVLSAVAKLEIPTITFD